MALPRAPHRGTKVRTSLTQRTNESWLAAMRGKGEGSAAAVADLQAYLTRVLSKAMLGRLGSDDIADLVQESLANIVKGLASFRGDSAFSTWATGIATRVAFTELRRRQVRAEKPGRFEVLEEELRRKEAGTPSPDELATQNDLLRALERAIASALTERQRLAIRAELRGIPTIEIARRLGTNQNALYKLTHDARKRLRAALLEAGYGADSIRAQALEASQ